MKQRTQPCPLPGVLLLPQPPAATAELIARLGFGVGAFDPAHATPCDSHWPDAASLASVWQTALAVKGQALDRSLARLPARLASRSARALPAGRQAYKLTAIAMPTCSRCNHPGTDHEHRIPRLKGVCLMPGCRCTWYLPEVPFPKAVNPVAGRIRWKRK